MGTHTRGFLDWQVGSTVVSIPSQRYIFFTGPCRANCFSKTSVLLSLDSSELFVVDWEFAQFGNWAYDLGQMIGDIYERAHFHSVDNAMLMMREFVLGYGGLNDELAFRVAIHSGVQLLGWYTRRAPQQPVFGTPSQIEQAARLGREFVLRGWRRDRLWFEQSVLAPLFT